MSKRISSGIDGLDTLLNGGLLPERNLLVIGGPGTGKTTFALQYIIKGAADYGDAGVFVTTEQSPYELRSDAKSFGWDIEKLEDDGLIKIVNAVPTPMPGQAREIVLPEVNPNVGYLEYSVDDILSLIFDVTRKIHAKRVAIDSITQFLFLESDPLKMRVNIIRLINTLKRNGMTIISTAQKYLSEAIYNEILTFIADGVVLLYLLRRGVEKVRACEIIKMRGSKHSLNTVEMKITDNGIVIFPDKTIEVTQEIVIF
ncbi:MAG: RAD55 family ATPase [Candidatus Asgardarchaeia archaeon]